jgi:hypothetical protein
MIPGSTRAINQRAVGPIGPMAALGAESTLARAQQYDEADAGPSAPSHPWRSWVADLPPRSICPSPASATRFSSCRPRLLL